MCRQMGTVKYPHQGTSRIFWTQVNKCLSVMEYSEVSQASTITKITLISKIQGEICLQIKQPWALLKSWKASIQNDDGKRDDSGDFTINGHFTCQCKLFVGVRYPISWLLRRGLKRLCFKSGEALQVHQQP